MTLYETYKNNKYKKYAGGGGIDPMSLIGTAQQLGTGIIDAVDTPDQFSGVGSRLGALQKGNLQGGAIGAALALLSNNKQRKEGMEMFNRNVADTNMADRSRSGAMLATNPELMEGHKNSGYFATGGAMLPGGEDPRKRAKTQAEVDAANAEARRMSVKHGLIAGEAMMAARRIGDRLPDYVDQNGRPAVPAPSAPKATTVPEYVMGTDIQSRDGGHGYIDEKTGNWMDIDSSLVNLPRFRTKANGGEIKAPLASMYMYGGKTKTLSSDNSEMVGKPHSTGGIDVPKLGAELEDGETTKDSFVFSAKLGFAQQHKPIAKAKGIIEKKPATSERVNSMKRLNEREDKLAMAQEYFKKLNGLS